jgi:hypothetical protein
MPTKIQNQKFFEPNVPKVHITQFPEKWALPHLPSNSQIKTQSR